MDLELSGKAAIVTGGSRGIGKSIARELALEGVDVAIAARNREALEATARDFATADSAAIMQDLAVEHLPYSTLISYLIRVLSSLTGNVAKHGGNTFIETAAPLEWSPKRFDEPERTLESGIRGVSAMGGFQMFSPTLAPEEVLGDHPERLRAMVVEGANPMLSFSDTSRWREARERLDLLVVIDPAMTETAQLAAFRSCRAAILEITIIRHGQRSFHVLSELAAIERV